MLFLQHSHQRKEKFMTHTLPELPWAMDALEPNYLKSTLEFHYAKHHQAYVNNLNKALEGTGKEDLAIEELLIRVKEIDESKRQAVINNGGGHYNHTLFWLIMGPNAGGEPTGELADAIKKEYGSFEEFKAQFANAGATQFGSGWAWLEANKEGKLRITKTANQDNCLMNSDWKPILTMDVWEHAYYLEHQNLRPQWIETFWTLINWQAVANNYTNAKAGKAILNLEAKATAGL
jgi:superoxide dismutase, Fe-Mn family